MDTVKNPVISLVFSLYFHVSHIPSPFLQTAFRRRQPSDNKVLLKYEGSVQVRKKFSSFSSKVYEPFASALWCFAVPMFFNYLSMFVL